MTNPIYGDSTNIANLLGVVAEEVVARAKALGITWTLRMGTIINSAESLITATLDGDSVPIAVTNMTGQPMVPGQRVYIIITPPVGNFIVGKPLLNSIVGAQATQSTGQTINNVTSTPISFNTVVYDFGGITSPVPFNSFNVPPAAPGIYAASLRVFVNPAVGAGRAFVEIVATTNPSGWRVPFGTGEQLASATMIELLDVLDSVSCNIFQSSGGAVTATAIMNMFRIA